MRMALGRVCAEAPKVKKAARKAARRKRGVIGVILWCVMKEAVEQ